MRGFFMASIVITNSEPDSFAMSSTCALYRFVLKDSPYDAVVIGAIGFMINKI